MPDKLETPPPPAPSSSFTVNNEDQHECPICQTELLNPIRQPCGHVACEGCLSQWLTRPKFDSTRNGCSVCRRGPYLWKPSDKQTLRETSFGMQAEVLEGCDIREAYYPLTNPDGGPILYKFEAWDYNAATGRLIKVANAINLLTAEEAIDANILVILRHRITNGKLKFNSVEREKADIYATIAARLEKPFKRSDKKGLLHMIDTLDNVRVAYAMVLNDPKELALATALKMAIMHTSHLPYDTSKRLDIARRIGQSGAAQFIEDPQAHDVDLANTAAALPKIWNALQVFRQNRKHDPYAILDDVDTRPLMEQDLEKPTVQHQDLSLIQVVANAPSESRIIHEARMSRLQALRARINALFRGI